MPVLCWHRGWTTDAFHTLFTMARAVHVTCEQRHTKKKTGRGGLSKINDFLEREHLLCNKLPVNYEGIATAETSIEQSLTPEFQEPRTPSHSTALPEHINLTNKGTAVGLTSYGMFGFAPLSSKRANLPVPISFETNSISKAAAAFSLSVGMVQARGLVRR